MSAHPAGSAYAALRTNQQRTFVDGIVARSLSQTEAYRQAYSTRALARSDRAVGRNAARLTANDRVAAAITERRAIAAKRTDANEDRIVAGILAVADDPEAKDADILRAWDLLGRRLGLWSDAAGRDAGVLPDASAVKRLADFGLEVLLATRARLELAAPVVEGTARVVDDDEDATEGGDK